MAIVRPENMDFTGHKFSAIIYGSPGIGKTTLACSAPAPVLIDFDRGVSRVRAQHRVPTIMSNTFEEVQSDVKSPDMAEFQTVIIDTGGSFVTFLKDWAFRTKTAARTKNGEFNSLKARAVMQQVTIEQLSNKLETPPIDTVRESLELAKADVWQVTEEQANSPAWRPDSEFRIYHYCPCEYCTGKRPGDADYGITATGTKATEGRTIAVDPDVIPLGSEVLINGVIYIAEDTGVEGKTIDLFINNHEQAAAMGTYVTTVMWR